ncbi:thioredoxin domain-containing protein [Candidatus Nomurabacteria bacterium]|nr:thioredoxin domain-containing protein [Candidatus Kaiserbacteria bacterium]MCB9815015.1 thioredoxin domain-containing protein [Candidatus Nomurabacteria bacterium]
MEPQSNQTSPLIPIAIIFGFALIALAIFFTNKDSEPVPVQSTPDSTSGDQVSDGKPRVVDATDYIYGNPNAPILMIEYSDYECPFCKQYHTTMNQIMDEYGISGKIAWVYRQFPLTQLHPNAAKISEAGLCVGNIGGNEAFWKFTNRIFEERDINAPTNVTRLPQYAIDAGVSQNDYIKCMNDERMKEAVLASAEDAFKIGARGTPYTVLVVGGQQAIINGAQPYNVVREIVQSLIDQIDGKTDVTPKTP